MSTTARQTTPEETLYNLVRWGNLSIALAFAANGVSAQAFESDPFGADRATVRPVHKAGSTPDGSRN
jgi:hypothetical protein